MTQNAIISQHQHADTLLPSHSCLELQQELNLSTPLYDFWIKFINKACIATIQKSGNSGEFKMKGMPFAGTATFLPHSGCANPAQDIYDQMTDALQNPEEKLKGTPFLTEFKKQALPKFLVLLRLPEPPAKIAAKENAAGAAAATLEKTDRSRKG